MFFGALTYESRPPVFDCFKQRWIAFRKQFKEAESCKSDDDWDRLVMLLDRGFERSKIDRDQFGVIIEVCRGLYNDDDTGYS